MDIIFILIKSLKDKDMSYGILATCSNHNIGKYTFGTLLKILQQIFIVKPIGN